MSKQTSRDSQLQYVPHYSVQILLPSRFLPLPLAVVSLSLAISGQHLLMLLSHIASVHLGHSTAQRIAI